MTNFNEYFTLIQELKQHKQVEFVERTITINDVNIRTCDVKPPRFKEENLYKNDRYRQLVPRGLCFVFINDQIVHILSGHKKFGNYGEFVPEELDLSTCITKYYNRKENGECAHVSFFRHNNITYMISGSKNVHMIVRVNKQNNNAYRITGLKTDMIVHVDETAYADLKLPIYKEERYMFAVKITSLILNKYTEQLYNAIDYVLESNITFCAESCFLDSQHLVEYKTDSLFFFAVTTPMSEKITHLLPLDTIKIFTRFELPKVSEVWVAATPEECKNVESKIEMDENSEGCVVTMVFPNDRTYVYKHKNYNYVFWRAVRTLYENSSNEARIRHRLNNLYIDHPNKIVLIEEAILFNAYYRLLSETDKAQFSSKWITHRHTFNRLSQAEKLNLKTQIQETNNVLLVIMFIGMPGSGKSDLGRILYNMLSNFTQTDKIVWYEQDMFAGNNASKLYDKAITQAIKNESTEVIILTKSNHNLAVRKKTYAITNKSPKDVNYVYVAFNSKSLEYARDVCVDRIMNRGNAHTTLFGKTKQGIYEILTNVFIKQWEELSNDEKQNDVITLPLEENRLDNAFNLIEQLNTLGYVSIQNDKPNIERAIEIVEQEKNKLAGKNKHKVVETKVELVDKPVDEPKDEPIDKLADELDKVTIRVVSNKPNTEKKTAPLKAKKIKEKYVEYDALVVPEPEEFSKSIMNIKEIADAVASRTVVVKKEFHITVEYFGKKKEEDIPDVYVDGKEIEYHIIGFAVDNDALALLVRIPDELKREKGNENSHITFALRPTVKAQYSNTLIKKSIENKTIIIFETPIVFVGCTKRIARFM
jgi:hypothetical protein